MLCSVVDDEYVDYDDNADDDDAFANVVYASADDFTMIRTLLKTMTVLLLMSVITLMVTTLIMSMTMMFITMM